MKLSARENKQLLTNCLAGPLREICKKQFKKTSKMAVKAF